jgi:predicted esterase
MLNMTTILRYLVISSSFFIIFSGPLIAEEDDVADIASRDLQANNHENMHYFLIGPRAGVKAPEKGFGLVIVLPGGDGGAEYNSFVKRIYKYAMPKNFLVAQAVAVRWAEKQEVTWPTTKNRVKGQKFSTEDFVGAIIDDVAHIHKLNPEHIFTLSWSSGGPAAYVISLSNKKVMGSFIGMSVFKPGEMPSLDKAKGRAYFIYHSAQDETCPIGMAEQAAKVLEKNGAKVKMSTYEGGHGWTGPVYDDISAGIKWLEENHAAASKQ